MNNFVEFVAVNKTQLDDITKQLDEYKSNPTPLPPEPVKKMSEEKQPPKKNDEIDSELLEVISSLPLKSREAAKDMIKHLLNGAEFGYDTKTGQILRFIPKEGVRTRIKQSNLRDILSMATRQMGPNQQPVAVDAIPAGLKEFLQMLSCTPLGCSQICDSNLRKLFQQYRNDRLT